MNVWRLMAHHIRAEQEEAIDWFRVNSRISIGWGEIGDLRDFHGASEISRRIQQVYGHALRNSPHGGASLWRFYKEMEIDDWVIVNDSRRRRMVMRIKGSYEFVGPPLNNYPHQRRAEYSERNPNELWTGPAPGENIRWTLLRCR